ncbi:hypothetical protein CIK76_02090 [Glutamicibacter sp. BW80]|uniref:ABC transporter substrate-binding protein n=1 Tax=Glutamicibacter sp. BW80 TaxID=2024404 RepID=UPI000BB750A8|nr:ABC transporter substrate-binding protein [Glutamicibacter sp. BW80]PCC30281.1 hypothetical protein CIK76_02090 [Glutamicibacter sp. BW80]
MRIFTPKLKKLQVVACLAAVGLLATACGGSDTASSNGEEVTKLVVGAAPSLSGIGVYAGVADGSFKEAGLDVSAVPNKSANEAIPQLLNGGTQIAMVDVITAMQARSQGLPVKIVSPAGVQSTNGEKKEMSAASVIAKADSKIDSPADLEGKKVGVPALKTQTWMNIRASIDADGGDSSKVQFIEAPPAQAVDLVVQGEVDASTPNEPLASTAISNGNVKLVMNTDAPGNQGAPTSVYMATEEFINANPETIKTFADSIQSVSAKINDDRKFAIDTAVSELNFTPEQLTNAFVQVLGEEPITEENLKKVSDLATHYEVLTEVPEASDLLANFGQ